MTAILTLLYPKGSKEFDLDYYLTKHMASVEKAWGNGKAGLQKWQVVKLDPSSGNVIKCILHWDSIESAQKAFGGDVGKAILADIPNYCDVEPLKYLGEVVGGN